MPPETDEFDSSGGAASQKCGIGIVIVNYRTPALTEECVSSIAGQLAAVDARVVVVDNHSEDGSFEALSAFVRDRQFGGRVQVVSAGRNGGFSAGNNVGIRRLKADWYLLLNSDAIARPNALVILKEATNRNPHAGIFSPAIVTPEGVELVSSFRKHTLLSEFVDGVHSGPVTRLFPRAEIPIAPGTDLEEADWVSFAAVLIHADAIEAVGMMDENFFLYFEDCDYCRQITSAGYSIAHAPNAVFVHDEGGATGFGEKVRQRERLPEYYYRSRARYFRKYYGPFGVVLANLAWQIGRIIAHLRGLFGRPAPKVCKNRALDMWIGWRGRA